MLLVGPRNVTTLRFVGVCLYRSSSGRVFNQDAVSSLALMSYKLARKARPSASWTKTGKTLRSLFHAYSSSSLPSSPASRLTYANVLTRNSQTLRLSRSVLVGAAIQIAEPQPAYGLHAGCGHLPSQLG